MSEKSGTARFGEPPGRGDDERDAAQLHGVVAGALVAGAAPGEAADYTAGAFGRPVAQDLRSCAERLARDLAGCQLAFRPNLPPDERPLAERADSLSAWVRGFLSGIGFAGERLQTLGEPAQESLADFEAIACGAEVSEAASEAEEVAYAQLVEYVRLAVQNLYEDLAGAA